MHRFSLKLATALMALIALFALQVPPADARVGGGSSIGSRGFKTWTKPPATNTAPRAAAPMQKSMQQPAKPAAPVAPATSGWGSTMRNLLLGGLIGAGLASLFGTGALSSILGFVLQAALIAGVVYLVMAWFRGRNAQPATAQASTGMAGRANPAAEAARAAMQRQSASYGGGGTPALAIKPEDYDAFEQRLSAIQLAYGRGDTTALSRLTTPEMLSYFSGDLEDNRRNGVRNEVGEPKLLQGDLAESWRETDGEYASVAMRFALTDAIVEERSGRVVSGSKTEPQEVTEIWTFRRPVGGNARQWELSAIQQAV